MSIKKELQALVDEADKHLHLILPQDIQAIIDKIDDGWISVDEPPENDNPVYVKVAARYKRYKPQSQQAKQGIVGRWQLHNGFGWNNTDIDICEYSKE